MPGVCPRCLREVYFAEEKLALGKVWHNFCFSCRNCRKLLDSWTVATHSGELFCRNCYNRLFSITSVRAALPRPINHIFPPADTKDFALLSPCDSLSDCCCCCYCNDEPALIDPQSQDSEIRGPAVCPSEEQRLRGGGVENEELPEANPILETSGAAKRCSESESCRLGARSSVNTISNPPFSPTAVTPWYNRQQSASQSIVSRSSSAQHQPLIRPSSTPASAQAAAVFNASACSAHRRPGSPCRANYEHHRYSKQFHRYHCCDSHCSDRRVGSQDHSKIIKDCQERNFIQNCRNHLSHSGRSLSAFVLQSERKSSILKPSARKPIIIDSSRPKSSYPPLPPHYTPPPPRRRVSFQSAEGAHSEDTAVCYPTMQNIVNEPRSSNVDIISFEHSAYEQEQNLIEENDINTFGNNNIETTDGHSEYESCEDDRMRGGCGGGGGGGSGCCCSGGGARTSPTLNYPSQSPCGKRYQGDRSSTVEGACGCSGRAQSGCGSSNSGGCCSTGNEAIPGHSSRIGGCCSSGGYEGRNEGACAAKDPCARRPTGYETCPPRSPDPCSPDPSTLSSCGAVACSPPCAGRNTCCPPAGCRPVRRRIARCKTPCTGDTQSCGGGGCCGSGCRGGCGKPGQTCLPLRPCTIPPCKPHPRGGGSPCMPLRRCAPPPPCCRSPALPGSPGGMSSSSGGGSSCCRSASPGGRSAGGGGCGGAPISQFQQQDEGYLDGSCCLPKLPAGCECLGGGQDCQRCGRKVYQAEMQIASGVPYHNICFSCFCCRKPLETLTYHENCGEIYCKQCYVRNFGPQGYGYSGVLQTPM